MTSPKHVVLTGLLRGVRDRCPNCAAAPLFGAYLKIIPVCAKCRHNNGQYPADDAPPYFTILIVGHLVVGPLLAFRFIWTWPTGVVLALVLPLLAILTLMVLPIVKGAVVGVLWGLGESSRLKEQHDS